MNAAGKICFLTSVGETFHVIRSLTGSFKNNWLNIYITHRALGIHTTPNTTKCSLPSVHSRRKSTISSMVECAQPCLNIADKECFKALFDENLLTLKNVCSKNEMDIRLAGGPVRDLLLGVVPHDLDFATTTHPEDMMKIFTKENIRMLEYGSRAAGHGTVTVRINDSVNYEITTTRSDVLCDGRHASVEFHQDWREDANRRDLTINSMFLDLNGNLYDYFNGHDDLVNKRVLFVGDADLRIKEDYLRILRYFRFYGRIKASPEDHDLPTLEIIRQDAAGLEGVAGERIWVELKKIVQGHFADHQIHHMIDLGVAKYIGLPSDCDSSLFTGVYERANKSGLDISESALLASLLSSTSQVEDFHKRLKLSRVEYNTMLFIVNERSRYVTGDPKYYQDLVLDSSESRSLLTRCVQLAAYMGDSVVYNALLKWEIPRMPFSAKVLLEAGVPKGKLLSQYINIIRQEWKDSNYKATNKQLVDYAHGMIKEAASKVWSLSALTLASVFFIAWLLRPCGRL